MSDGETEGNGDAKRSPLARLRGLFGARHVLFLAVLLALASLIGATRYTPRLLLARIVTLDAQRLAMGYLGDLASAFQLPGKPIALSGRTVLEANLLLGTEPRSEASFDLFDTARYNSASTSQSVRGYVVLNRFGDRVFSAGNPLHRSLESARAAARFEAAEGDVTVRAYKNNRIDDASDMMVSVVVPLVAGADGAFAGAVTIDVHRNGVEAGVLAGIERSIFALVVLVLGIASGLLVLLTLLRVRGERARRHANYLAQFDPLTGLHNREAFLVKLTERIRLDHERKRHFASVLIDVRRFGWINDTFGDHVGDEALKAFGHRLDEKLRRDPDFAQCGATAARLGADEFAAFFSCDTRAQLEKVCRSLGRICETGIEVKAIRLEMRAAFGAALFPFDGRSADDLQASVRYALDIAKSDATSVDQPASLRIFDTDIANAHRRRRKLLQDVEGAIAADQMEVHYQPQVRVGKAGTRLVGFEALLRWKHPEEGLVSPAEFIPLAEQSGTIRELGVWCLREACREAASWPGEDAPTIAVNVSPAQFVGDMEDEPGLVANVAAVLRETDLAPERLELEVTEGLPLGEASEILSGLESLGVGLALDDFGTGYSSLSYLSSIPVGKVKLDRAFVLRMATDEKVRSIVRAVTSMCDGMGMTVLAEGVETVDEQELLLELGCFHLQGYLHGRPERTPQLEAFGDVDRRLAA